MKCRLHVGQLGDALAAVARAISSKPVKPIMEGILLEASGSCAHLTGTDGNLTIRTDVTAMVEEDGSTVLPGKLFADLIRRLPGDTVDIETDGSAVKIRCGRSRSSVTAMNPEDFPDGGTFRAAHKLTVPCGKLKDMISGVAFSVATDASRLALTGIRVEAGNEALRMTALDGFRLAETMEVGYFDAFTAIIPGAAMNELSRILPSDSDVPCELTLSDRSLTADFGPTTLTTVILSAEYPDTSRIIPATFATEMRVSRAELQGAIERTELIARGGHNNLIRMQVSDGRCALSSRAEVGEVAEEVSAEVSGKDQTIALNAKYLTDVFKAVACDVVTVKMNSAVTPVVIMTEDNDALYLVLPVRTA